MDDVWQPFRDLNGYNMKPSNAWGRFLVFNKADLRPIADPQIDDLAAALLPLEIVEEILSFIGPPPYTQRRVDTLLFSVEQMKRKALMLDDLERSFSYTKELEDEWRTRHSWKRFRFHGTYVEVKIALYFPSFYEAWRYEHGWAVDDDFQWEVDGNDMVEDDQWVGLDLTNEGD